MIKITIVALIAFLSINSFAQPEIRYADSLRKANHIPELAYAVVTDRSVITAAAIGYHSILLNDTATLNDRFHIGSNTKAMTAFIIAKYVEKGKLKWDTRFFDIYPEWQKSSKKAYDGITLQDLLSHKAFIQPFQGEGDTTVPDFKGSRQQKRAAFGKFVLTLEPAKIDSNNKFVYSNAGYTLAALMLERVTNLTWEQLVNQVFNKDLKLNVKLSWPDNQSEKDTWGHSYENGKLTPVPSNTGFHLDYTEPAGDINIELPDYVKFIQMNLRGLEGQNNYLKASTYKFIHEGIPNYSLGWFNIYEDNKSLSTHSGTAGTYYSLVHIDRKAFIGYVIFTNSFTEETINGARLLMRMLKTQYGNKK
ncbi:serine hydrolase domain-containing protein [Pedobacter rhodius]|uniref:Serine hydrolase n=1 Tax=Pedobacter rhodius TaxID=3004098 RepID=A0ABT4KWP9_9SPHI|nr:serine hydrolase domain-containing protein [Pedobacter sp. SJ11]MCZ4223347.1 serine hydrolase [Pedobacter sp. SJ11]